MKTAGVIAGSNGKNGCAICGDSMDLKMCSACHHVGYCSTAHQREHWKTHKVNCKPIPAYKIEENSNQISGKQLTAGRDYEQGAIIFEHLPLFHYNMPSEHRSMGQCVSCGVVVANSGKRCSLCQWPVCSDECEKAPLHALNECKIFVENETSYPPREMEGPDFAMIARAFSIRCQNSRLWDEILNLMPLYLLDEFSTKMETVVRNLLMEGKSLTAIQSKFPQFLFNQEPIIKDEIQGQLTVIGRRAGFMMTTNYDDQTLAHMYLYKDASYLVNSCRPNCVWNIGAFPDFKIRLRAAVPIRRGQRLTVNRQGHLYLGSLYRQRLFSERFKQNCTCKMCLDPTELGTMQSAITCTACREQDPPKLGYLLPTQPSNERSADMETAEWKCCGCSSVQPASTFLTRLNEIYDGVQKSGQSKSKLVNGKEVYMILKEDGGDGGHFLHPNHWLIQQTLYNYVQAHADILIPADHNRGDENGLGNLEPQLRQCVHHMMYLVKILDKTCPGIGHERVRICLLLGDAILTLSKDLCISPSFSKMDKEATLNLEEELIMSLKYLEEALLYWRGTPVRRGCDGPDLVDNLTQRITTAKSILDVVQSKIFDFRKNEEEADVVIQDWGMRMPKPGGGKKMEPETQTAVC